MSKLPRKLRFWCWPLVLALLLSAWGLSEGAWSRNADEADQAPTLLARNHKSKKSADGGQGKSAVPYVASQYLVNLADITPPQRGRTRLATWNLHDFFDTVDDPNRDEVLTPREFATKIAIMTKVLKGMQADIVGVQEVENSECLARLAKEAGYGYSLVVEGNDQVRGIDVGVLSKIPIKNYVTHARERCYSSSSGRGHSFSRDCLEVHFNHPSRLTMLVNHFKSKRGNEDSVSFDKRLSQATKAREIAKRLDAYPVVLVGDLNDDPESPALAPLIGKGGMFDALSCIDRRERVTFSKGRFHSSLDYIFFNQKLAPKMVKNSTRIVLGKEVREASDHRPVFVDVIL